MIAMTYPSSARTIFDTFVASLRGDYYATQEIVNDLQYEFDRLASCRSLHLANGNSIIGKNQNTFEKRRREMEKKRKADEKRKRRKERNAAESASPSGVAPGAPDEPEDGSPPSAPEPPQDS